jgi:thiol-disulfide isomerase/thioredoxin
LPSRSSPSNAIRPLLSRRSIIAATAGLALSGIRGNSAQAQISTGDLPDAAGLLEQIMPAPAPDLKFTSAAGKPLTLASYRGSGLVVNIWATWCGPCVAELPTFAAISHSLAKSKILVLPISVDLSGTRVVQPFYTSHNITDLPILLDPDGSAVDALNAEGIPITIIINPQGQLVARLEGSANWNSAASLALIKQLAGPKPNGSDVQPA